MHDLHSLHMNIGHTLFVFGILVTSVVSFFGNKGRFGHVKLHNGPLLDNSSSSTSSSQSRKVTEVAIRRAHEESLELYNRFRSCKDGFITKQLNSALDILYDALRLYGPQQLFSSFNGGKDAVVIMHLLRAVTAKYSDEHGIIYRPNLVYFAMKDEFPEVLEHIDESEELYCLNLTRYDTAISQGLSEHIKACGSDRGVAFVLGTRKGDPNCGNQQHFAPSRYAFLPLSSPSFTTI